MNNTELELHLKKLLLLYPFAVTKEQIRKLLGFKSISEVNKWLTSNKLSVDIDQLTQQEANRILTKSVPIVYVTDLVADEIVEKEFKYEKI